jgi:hypothetical protein
MNHLEKDGWLLWKENPIVDFWSYNNVFIIEAFFICELQKCEKEVLFKNKNWTVSIQVFKKVVHWNVFNNINSKFLRSTTVSFESFKVHTSLKIVSFLMVFFSKKHDQTWV